MKITGIWITKNSEKFIGYSIASLANVLDQIVVMDGDSIDNTHKIVLSFKSPKIQMSVLKEGLYDMDHSGNFGFSQANGDVMLLLGDDYVYDDKSAQLLRTWCATALQQNKKGLVYKVYNIAFSPRTYFTAVDHAFAVCQQKNDPLTGVGSFYSDTWDIIHKSEIRTDRKRKISKGRRQLSEYLEVPGLSFGHYKYMKDTKEYFIHKFILFRQKICDLQYLKRRAEEEWQAIQDQPRFNLPVPIPEVFYRERKQLVPLGGFDVEKVV